MAAARTGYRSRHVAPCVPSPRRAKECDIPSRARQWRNECKKMGCQPGAKPMMPQKKGATNTGSKKEKPGEGAVVVPHAPITSPRASPRLGRVAATAPSAHPPALRCVVVPDRRAPTPGRATTSRKRTGTRRRLQQRMASRLLRRRPPQRQRPRPRRSARRSLLCECGVGAAVAANALLLGFAWRGAALTGWIGGWPASAGALVCERPRSPGGQPSSAAARWSYFSCRSRFRVSLPCTCVSLAKPGLSGL